MKPSLRLALTSTALTTLVTLTGCETTSAVVGASQKGLGALSCSEIYNTFNAYNRDQQTLAAVKELSYNLGIPYTGGSPSEHLKTAKTSANVALLAQGCSPLPQ